MQIALDPTCVRYTLANFFDDLRSLRTQKVYHVNCSVAYFDCTSDFIYEPNKKGQKMVHFCKRNKSKINSRCQNDKCNWNSFVCLFGARIYSWRFDWVARHFSRSTSMPNHFCHERKCWKLKEATAKQSKGKAFAESFLSKYREHTQLDFLLLQRTHCMAARTLFSSFRFEFVLLTTIWWWRPVHIAHKNWMT